MAAVRLWGARALATSVVLAAALLGAGETAVAASIDSSTSAQVPGGQPAFAWGNNSTAGLGTGSEAGVAEPLPVELPPGTVGVATGIDYEFAFTAAGALYAWGGNAHGQLGIGSTDAARDPARVALPAGTRIVEVATTSSHALALDSDGGVWTWGRNHRGQLGSGDDADRSTPARLDLGAEVVSIAAGIDHSLAVTADGAVLAWGRNDEGQLGDGSRIDSSSPVEVMPAGSGVVSVVAGDAFSAALDARGRVYVWGDRRVTGGSGATRPTRGPDGLGTVVQLDAGASHLLALDSAGSVLAWGADARGQLGTERDAKRLPGQGWSTTEPITVGLPPVAQIAAGGDTSLALTRAGEVYSWGSDQFGQLGDSTGTDRAAPARIPALIGAKVSALDVGGTSAFAIVEHGPAARLKIGPDDAEPVVGQSFRFDVTALDAFGTSLGPIAASLDLDGEPCAEAGCTPTKSGVQTVTAIAPDPAAEARTAQPSPHDDGGPSTALAVRARPPVGLASRESSTMDAAAPVPAVIHIPAGALFGVATVTVREAAGGGGAGGGAGDDGTGEGGSGEDGAGADGSPHSTSGALSVTGGVVGAGLLSALGLAAVAAGIVIVVSRRRRFALESPKASHDRPNESGAREADEEDRNG